MNNNEKEIEKNSTLTKTLFIILKKYYKCLRFYDSTRNIKITSWKLNF